MGGRIDEEDQSGTGPTLAAGGRPADPEGATMAAGSGPGAGQPHEATMAAGSGPGAGQPHAATLPSGAGSMGSPADARVIIRQGRQDDYRELAVVDPGHYVIGHEIARGGMGRIRAARDRRLGRQVAIKELLVESGDLRARFEREARITAKLQHPSVVSLLEAGSWPTGEPFYVMKLVTGESLDKAIASRPTLDARLALVPNVIATVDALAYAHTMRVIHRDLKPANVLVGEFGETVVIDWGLAKDLADTSGRDEIAAGPRRAAPGTSLETVAGAVMGTPAYMPPEQARGDTVDERADVYALGAMLYHVLAGAPPYRGATIEAILDAVLHDPPPPLATCVAGIPPDLITIVNKAMAPAVAARYPTAKEFADDLKKFQTGQLVSAHRYSSWQLARRWLRRHRTAVVITGVAAMVFAVFGVLSLQRIFAEQARTEQQRRSAVASRAEAEDLTTFMLGDLPAKLRPLGRLELLRDVATKASAYYDRRVDDLSEPELSRRARARRNLGDVLIAQGRSDAALAEHRASLALAREVAARDPNNLDWQRELADSHRGLGEVLFARGDVEAALRELRGALATTEALPDLTSSTGDDRPRNIAVIRDRIGEVRFAQGETSAALVEHRAARALLLAQLPKDPTISASLAQNHANLGEALAAQGDVDDALAEFQAGKALAAHQIEADPRNTAWQERLVIAHTRVGKALLQQGDLVGALAEYRGGLAIATSLVARDPSNADWKFMLNSCHRRVGKVLLQQGDAAGALASYRAGLALSVSMAALDASHADWHAALASDHDAIGNVLLRQGDPTGALAEYRAAGVITKRLADKDPTDLRPQRDLMAVHNKTGAVAYAQDNAELAIAEFAAALEISKVLEAADPTNADRQRELAAAHANLGTALVLAGDLERARGELREFHAIAEALAAKDPTSADRQWDLAMSHSSMGDLLMKQKHRDEALASYRAGHELFERLVAIDPTNVDRQVGLAGSHHTLGDALAARGDVAAASAAYRAALAIAQAVLAKEPDHAEVRDMLKPLTRKLRRRP